MVTEPIGKGFSIILIQIKLTTRLFFPGIAMQTGPQILLVCFLCLCYASLETDTESCIDPNDTVKCAVNHWLTSQAC